MLKGLHAFAHARAGGRLDKGAQPSQTWSGQHGKEIGEVDAFAFYRKSIHIETGSSGKTFVRKV